MQVRHTAIYPVVDPSPSNFKTISNFNIKDWGAFLGGGFAGYSFGWMTAAKQLRRANARITCSLGLLGGLCYGMVSTINRFSGLEPNEVEVAKYGSLTDAQLTRYYAKLAIPNASLIDSTNPLDEPSEKPVKRYGAFSPEDIRTYRERSKEHPHVFDPLNPSKIDEPTIPETKK